jgi:hypothetical protein
LQDLRPAIYPSDTVVRETYRGDAERSSQRKVPRGFLDYYLNTLEAFRDDDIASENRRPFEYLIALLDMSKAYMSGHTSFGRYSHRLNVDNSITPGEVKFPFASPDWSELRLQIDSFYALIKN